MDLNDDGLRTSKPMDGSGGQRLNLMANHTQRPSPRRRGKCVVPPTKGTLYLLTRCVRQIITSTCDPCNRSPVAILCSSLRGKSSKSGVCITQNISTQIGCFKCSVATWPEAVIPDSTGPELTRKSQGIQRTCRKDRARRNAFDDTTRKQSAEVGIWKTP